MAALTGFSTARISAIAALYSVIGGVLLGGLTSCATLVSSAANGLAGNLSTAILNQDDPETVRDGAPAYLLMLDSFVEGSPDDIDTLRAAAELYSAYGVIFVDDPERAKRLTARAWSYGKRALCASNRQVCGVWEQNFEDFSASLAKIRDRDTAALYTFGLSWIAYIRAHTEDWAALAQLPQVEAVFKRVQTLQPGYEASKVEHYLGILNTIRPPALGGDFEAGRQHYQRAIELSEGKDLSIKVDYAKYYARSIYDRALHDQLLNEVIAADPNGPGYTLFNTLAQRLAQALLKSADDYF
jgi:hypothetical protein